MAETLKFTKTFSLLLFTFSILITASKTMEKHEDNHRRHSNNLSLRDLNSAIFTLRSNGYNLFANAIAVSDISFQILTSNFTGHGGGGKGGFTFLAPPNTALFSLDMSTDAFTYVHSLRFHVISRRLSYADLRRVSVSKNPYVEPLAGGHEIAFVSTAGDVVAVDGVAISFPDMYVHSKIAVHGLDGILVSSTARVDHELGFVAAPQPFAGAFSSENVETHSPKIGVPSPVSSFAPFTIGSSFRPVPPENVEVLSPVTSSTIGSDFSSVSFPPVGYSSPEIGKSPITSPTPSPSSQCSDEWTCEIEFLSPYIWPPMTSSSPSSMAAEAEYRVGGYDEKEKGEDLKRRELGFQIEDDDRVNFGEYNQIHDDTFPFTYHWW